MTLAGGVRGGNSTVGQWTSRRGWAGDAIGAGEWPASERGLQRRGNPRAHMQRRHVRHPEEDTLGGPIGVDCVREAEMDEQSAEQEDEKCDYAAFGSGRTSS